ncbi:MaoC family dehydratase [Ectobacillus polymachus]|uniref:MaoC family dehydratase n=1 Tax=Ectobacillus polymachus TaxID=1508806 RepID=UPI003A84CD2C
MCVRISRTFTITEEKINQYACLSGDLNPIHLNQKEAERAGFPAPIAHGMLTMGLTLEITSFFAEKGLRISSYDMQFLKPVFRNDTIRIVAMQKQKNAASDIILEGFKGTELVIRGKIVWEDSCGNKL